ncbi:MAG: hypothetical protein A2806_00490 [Candidatus Terrybacteria bacterium RIFCSPHIGHO2_01_FULL_48_17]|uniref:Uncharacterized protein n=1 Tax=Candidatus Terrybacteria bacterium RIFCSPHIGHO2_01_FULL_48_17 TaxID=1802362 RepID=A0A1G2PI63_9BACT|nr:MAG: hypothetical protein A2806_00490 [Candidatus Terrybacteria bacterium RIFCSPHIGHO2_01_FULL_48_17]
MEKFDFKEYRDQLAEDLKNIPNHDERKSVLESEKESARYKKAKSEQAKGIADFIDSKSLGIEASIQYQKDKKQYLRERTAHQEEKLQALKDKSKETQSELKGLEKEKLGLEKEKFMREVEEGQKYASQLLEGGFLDKPENLKLYVDEVEQKINKNIQEKAEYGYANSEMKFLENRLSVISEIRGELARGDQYVFDKELAKKLLSIESRPGGLTKSQSGSNPSIFIPAETIQYKYEDETKEKLKELQQIGKQKIISTDQEIIKNQMRYLAIVSKIFPDISMSELEKYAAVVIGLDDRGYLYREREKSRGDKERRPFEIICEDGRKWRLPKALEKIYFQGATEEGSPITRFAGNSKEHYGRYVAVGDYEFETLSSSCAGEAGKVEGGIKFGGGNDSNFSMKMFKDAESSGLLPIAVPGTPLFVEQYYGDKRVTLPISSNVPEIIDGYTIPIDDVFNVPLGGDKIEKIKEEKGSEGVNAYISKLIKDKLDEKMRSENSGEK